MDGLPEFKEFEFQVMAVPAFFWGSGTFQRLSNLSSRYLTGESDDHSRKSILEPDVESFGLGLARVLG